MGAPGGGETAIYAQGFKRNQTRVIVGLDPPKFVQEQVDPFSASPLNNYAWAMQWVGGGPLIDSGKLKFRSYGVPLFEWASTRESYGWFPYSRDFPFKLVISGINFPTADPVYSVPIIVPGLENLLGDLDDPLLLYQQGSATPSATGVIDHSKDGHIRIFSQGTDVSDIANDMADHELIIEWDPLLQVNSYKFTLKWDTVDIFHTNTATAPNTKAHFGWGWNMMSDISSGVAIEAPGSVASPVVVMQIDSVKTTQLGSLGYETYDDPPWTIPNAGGTTHENSAIGEIHTQDNIRWAIMPNRLISDIQGDRGRNVQIGTATVNLNVRHNDPDELYSFAWTGRPILIDTRQVNSSGTSDWRRQIAGFIKKSDPSIVADSLKQVLSINSMPEEKMNKFITHTWRGAATSIAGITVGVEVNEVWEDILDIAEAVHGSIPTVSDRLIRSLPLLVGDIGTGGGSLLPTYAQLVDGSAYEYYVDYTTTGDSRHGRMRTHAWNLGDGTPDYSISRQHVLRFAVHESAEEGPSQVSYRQNQPDATEDTLVSTWVFPTVGLFPTVPLPITNRILSDSMGFANSLQESSLVQLRDKSNAVIDGGIAQHRFRLQSAQRRTAEATIRGHDHLEPSDEIDCGDPASLPGETWVIDRISWSIKEQVFEANITASTSKWLEAIKRSL